MQKLLLLIFMGWVAGGCQGSRAVHAPVKPIVFTLNADALAYNKSRIAANDPAVLPAYQQLLKEAAEALEFGPVSVMEKVNLPPSGDKHDYMSLAPYYWPDPTKADGLPYIRKDGQTTPEVKDYKDKEYMPKLCAEVNTLALAYYFSGDKLYAAHASKLVRVWFLDTATRMNPNLNFGQAMKGHNTGRGAGLIDTRHFVKLIDALGLLQASNEFTNADKQGMQQWFSGFLDWMQTSKNGLEELEAKNNHGAWYDAQRLAMALYIGDEQQAKSIALNAADRLDKQMDEAGRFPKEMERTISLHYTSFVMHAFFNIAHMSEKAGVDFWNLTTPSGKSLQKAFAELRPYLIKEKAWHGSQIKSFNYEDGFPLLMDAAVRLKCGSCKEDVKQLAGDKAAKLRINLLYK